MTALFSNYDTVSAGEFGWGGSETIGSLSLYSPSLDRAYPARGLPDDDTAGTAWFFCRIESLPAGTTAGRLNIGRSGAAMPAFH